MKKTYKDIQQEREEKKKKHRLMMDKIRKPKEFVIQPKPRKRRLRKIENEKELFALKRRSDLLKRRTKYEIIFENDALKLGIKLVPQYIMPEYFQSQYVNLYFADLCDPIKKYVFEIDGEYHNDKEQRQYDKLRTEHFNLYGYRVFRIKNDRVEQNKHIQMLKRIYNI